MRNALASMFNMPGRNVPTGFDMKGTDGMTTDHEGAAPTEPTATPEPAAEPTEAPNFGDDRLGQRARALRAHATIAGNYDEPSQVAFGVTADGYVADTGLTERGELWADAVLVAHGVIDDDEGDEREFLEAREAAIEARRSRVFESLARGNGEVPMSLQVMFGINADGSVPEGGLTDDGREFADMIANGIDDVLKQHEGHMAKHRPHGPHGHGEMRALLDGLGLRAPIRTALRAAAQSLASSLNDGAADDAGSATQPMPPRDPSALPDEERDGVFRLGGEPFVLVRANRLAADDAARYGLDVPAGMTAAGVHITVGGGAGNGMVAELLRASLTSVEAGIAADPGRVHKIDPRTGTVSNTGQPVSAHRGGSFPWARGNEHRSEFGHYPTEPDAADLAADLIDPFSDAGLRPEHLGHVATYGGSTEYPHPGPVADDAAAGTPGGRYGESPTYGGRSSNDDMNSGSSPEPSSTSSHDSPSSTSYDSPSSTSSDSGSASGGGE